jgi:membrane protein YdbS with pleckstrin-like domain
MEHFTNEVIDTRQLPRFEAVVLSKLNPNYGKVIGFNILITFLIFAGGLVGLVFFNTGLRDYWRPLLALYVILFAIVVFFSALSLKKKAFAFRTHDVIFQSGVIATNTIVIPYNRVQHVALHEGLIARFFGLAKVEIFTAGGSASDISIPGIALAQAEDIKQLLMGKIQKQL